MKFVCIGTLWTTLANILTALTRAVLFLSWGVAQLGWIAGPVAIIIFALDTYNNPQAIEQNTMIPD